MVLNSLKKVFAKVKIKILHYLITFASKVVTLYLTASLRNQSCWVERGKIDYSQKLRTFGFLGIFYCVLLSVAESVSERCLKKVHHNSSPLMEFSVFSVQTKPQLIHSISVPRHKIRYRNS